MAMTNLIEQACNHYLETGAFPATYEEAQAVPVQKVGQLPFAGDDGMQAGKTYRALLWVAQSCDLSTRAEAHQASLVLELRSPDEQGIWSWGAWSAQIPLPATVCASLEQGATPLAPTLRETTRPDGSRVAVLDLILEVPTRRVPPRAQERRVLGFDWGVRSLITASVVEKRPDKRYPQVSRPMFLDTGGIDGRQARLRREIDRLKACRAHYAALCTEALSAHAEQQTRLSADLPRWEARVRDYEARIGACWQKYARRNRELAHLAANLLILLALLADCHLICGENLATLRTEGRGRGVRGRWRNWRNNTTVRGELWRVLSYKCARLRIRCPNRWSRAGPPTPARAATSRPGPLPLRPRPTAARPSRGVPGCAAKTRSVGGTARGITPPASTSPGSAWPCSSRLARSNRPSPLP